MASRPTRLRSPPWPAIPTTSDPKTSGTMIDLIIRKNTVESGRRVVASAGAAQPTRVPTTKATRIHWVSVVRRSRLHIGVYYTEPRRARTERAAHPRPRSFPAAPAGPFPCAAPFGRSQPGQRGAAAHVDSPAVTL